VKEISMPEPLEIAVELGQKCLQGNPVIVVGSGCSIPFGIPSMPQLAKELSSSLDASDLPAEDQDSLKALKAEISTTDLESALHKVSLSDQLISRVVQATWNYIAPADRKALAQVIRKRDLLPLSRLFVHLFQSTHTRVSIVTPNYDRLAEYAADAAEFHHSVGFGYGYIRARQAVASHLYTGARTTPVRTVEIWKVHGSLDWFADEDGTVVGLPMPPEDMTGLSPVIVTPGVNKYQRALEEPFRSILAGADLTLQSAGSYFCVGYGFNDRHIQPKLIEKCNRTRTPIVVLAKTLSDAAKGFLFSGRCSNFLALEDCTDGTMMYRAGDVSGSLIPGKSLWSLNEFLNVMI